MFGSLTEREKDEEGRGWDIRSVWHVFELGVVTQAKPVTTTLQFAKSASPINFQKNTHSHSQSTRIRSTLSLAHAHFLCTYSESTDTHTHIHFHICCPPAVGKTENAYIVSITMKDEWKKDEEKKVYLSQFAGTWIRREIFMNLIVYKFLMFSTFTFSWLSVQRLDTRGWGFYDFMNLATTTTTRTLLFLFFSF